MKWIISIAAALCVLPLATAVAAPTVAIATRIVSLTPTATEMVYAVGAGSHLVGDTTFDDYPDAATRIAKVGGFSPDTISIESIVALKPDLVLGQQNVDEPIQQALSRFGIRVVLLDIGGVESVYTNITRVGELTGADGAAVASAIHSRVQAIAERVSGLPPVRVFWETWDNPLMSAGPGTYISELISLAGGVNIFADVKSDWPTVSPEEVVKRNPQFILGAQTQSDTLRANELAKRPGWSDIAAVKNGDIVLLPDDIVSRPGPRIAEALEAIARALHPDAFR